MKWLLAAALIGGSSLYLYTRYREQIAAPPQPIQEPPQLAQTQPQPFLSADDLRRVKKSAEDPDSGVRWSALQLLFAFRDPDSVKLLEKAIAEDPDPDLRMKAIRMLKDAPAGVNRVPGLVRGLSDTDPDIRIASLKALASVGDPAATPWVVELIKDPESAVRIQALKTLGQFQDERKKEFEALAYQLRKQYEEAIRKSKHQNKKEEPWNNLE